MKELGDYLKEARKKNGVGIDEAAEDLQISVDELKNIESGNTRNFKDKLELKEYVKKYAKYLGLDSEKIVDEFNDFLFEHTSKISLNDILEAEKENNNEKRKEIHSPYIKQKKQILDAKQKIILYEVLCIIVFFIGLVLILSALIIPKKEVVNRELLGKYDFRGEIYEYSK